MASVSVSQPRLTTVAHKRAASSQRQRLPRHLLIAARPCAASNTSEGEVAVGSEAAPPAPEAAQMAVSKQGMDKTWDEQDYGFEAGGMPERPAPGELSEDEDEEAAEVAKRKAAYAAHLKDVLGDWVPPTEEELVASRDSVLESLDGMVGNYEFELDEKRGQLQEAADDYQRILAELQQLEVAAGVKGGMAGMQAAAGGGAAVGAEAGEGAGVEDLE